MTGQESPQSITVNFYYRGFSILLTKRDPSVEVKPLLEEAMKSIDWAILHNLQPSWNPETNAQAAASRPIVTQDSKTHVTNPIAEQKRPMSVDEFEDTCDKCGAKKILSKKGNKVCSKFCWTKK